MTNHYSELRQYESKLSGEARNVSLLGQIELSPADLTYLGALIRQVLSVDIRQGTRFLEQEAPTCLACFLVWTGIVGYRDGDYWSAVREATGLIEDPNWQTKWGQIFLNVLKTNNLRRFEEIESTLTYVTPILAHGGIPNSCLDEFFEKIVLPMVRRDLIDPIDPEEIIHELAIQREDDKERARVEREYEDLRSQTNAIASKVNLPRRLAEAYDEVVELWKLEELTKITHALVNLPEDYEAFRAHKFEDLGDLEEQIRSLEQKQTICQQVVARFTEQDKWALAQAKAIERCVAEYPGLKSQQQILSTLETEEAELVSQLSSQSTPIFSELWNDEHGEALIRLPFDELREEIRRFEVIVSRQNEDQKAVDHFRASSGTSSRTWPILVFILPLLGLIFLVIGVQVLLSWGLALVGIGFTMIAGFAGWFWNRETTKKKKQLEILEQAFKETIGERGRVQERIAGILGGLPIAEQQLRSPSLELYQALVLIADAYREFCDVRGRRIQFQQKVIQQVQQIEQIATSIGIQPARSLDDVIIAMEQALGEARERQAAAAQAAKELEDDVQSRLAEANAKHQAIRDELAQVDKQLVELGAGNIATGIKQLKALRELQKTATHLRTELKKRYAHFDLIEREIRNAQRNGNDKAALEAEARWLGEQLGELQTQLDKVRQQLTCHPAAFSGVDEPVRRFLLYGDKLAEEFLVSSVLLVHQTREEGKVPNADDVGLPGRVVTAFERWWTEHGPEVAGVGPPVEIDPTTGQRFRAPVISLDPGMAEIVVRLPPQRYLASIAGTRTCLEVVGSPSASQRQTVNLRVYGSRENLVETQALMFPLPFPAERYLFSLMSDNNAIHRWESGGIHTGAQYMAFDQPSGKLIQDEELPKRKVWFLVRRDFSLEPASCILSKGDSLYGQWKDYVLLELDLDQVDELHLVDSEGRCFPILVSSEKSSDLGLVDGQRLEGVYSGEAEIYVGPPPRLRVPVEDEAELRLWRLSIFPEGESSLPDRKHYRLSELLAALDAHMGEGYVDVLMTNPMLLGQHPVGNFTIHVRRSPHVEWSSTFCVVPALAVVFDRDVYLPYEPEKVPVVRAKITTDQAAEFVPQSPARLEEAKNDVYTARVDGRENDLRGTLRLSSPDHVEQQIPLTIRIPKVRWRLHGLADDQYATWRDAVEEIWFGDEEIVSEELFLVVELPAPVDGRFKLALGNVSGKEDEKKTHVGIARFDLLPFEDALRAGPSVQTFTLTLRESQLNIKGAPLCKVRTRWEAVNIECVQESQGQTVALKVTWTEQGKTGNKDRLVRLWSISSVPSEPILEQKVLDGTYAVLHTSVTALPPGKYLLQLALEDPWSPTPVSHPGANAPNTRVVEIVPEEVVSGTGRKNNAVAKAVVRKGNGTVQVNGQPLWDYFAVAPPKARGFLQRLLELDQVHEALSKVDILIVVQGSNPHTIRQPKAVTHALAKALIAYDPELRSLLKRQGFGGVRVSKHHSKQNQPGIVA